MRFGAWDLYAQSQHLGWRITPDYLWLFRDYTYSGLAFKLGQSNLVARISTALALATFAATAYMTFKSKSLFSKSYEFIIAAAFIFYISGAAMSNNWVGSMARHNFSVYVLLILAWVPILKNAALPVRILFSFAGLLSFALNAHFLWMYLRKQWMG